MKLLAVFALTASVSIPIAKADHETSPMFGGAILGGASTEPSQSMAGVELEAAVWWRWIGLAGEASWRVLDDDGTSSVGVLGGSVRLRLLQALVPSLFEPSDVELGIELQGIVEQTVWNGALTEHEPARRGVGIALRLRGATEDYAPRLIAESRFFVRVLDWRQPEENVLARTSMPPSPTTREVVVMVGIGAAFGGGEPHYLARFRRRALDTPLQ